MSRFAHIRLELPGPPERVFDHFVRPDLLTAWWPDIAGADATVGGAYHLHFAAPDMHRRGTFTTTEPPHRLGYTWEWDHEDTPPRQVSITLRSDGGDSTTVGIQHEAGSDDEHDGYVEGWEFFLARLRDVLA